eukprot:355191-Chlamydomonas_euryale.AAC.1
MESGGAALRGDGAKPRSLLCRRRKLPRQLRSAAVRPPPLSLHRLARLPSRAFAATSSMMPSFWCHRRRREGVWLTRGAGRGAGWERRRQRRLVVVGAGVLAGEGARKLPSPAGGVGWSRGAAVVAAAAAAAAWRSGRPGKRCAPAEHGFIDWSIDPYALVARPGHIRDLETCCSGGAQRAGASSAGLNKLLRSRSARCACNGMCRPAANALRRPLFCAGPIRTTPRGMSAVDPCLLCCCWSMVNPS